MGGELVSGSLPLEGSRSDDSTPLITYTEQFEKHCPYYLSIGMTYEQYWYGHSDMARYFRKASEIQNDRKNQELWLQGMYFYEAISRVSPLLHAFAKGGTKAEPYLDKPYPITKKAAINHKEEREKAAFELNKARFEATVSAINHKFKGQSEVIPDGDRNRSITD